MAGQSQGPPNYTRHKCGKCGGNAWYLLVGCTESAKAGAVSWVKSIFELACAVFRHEKENPAPRRSGAGVNISRDEEGGKMRKCFTLSDKKRALDLCTRG